MIPTIPPDKFWQEFRKANAERAEQSFNAIADWPSEHWRACLVFEAGEVGNLLKKLQRHQNGMVDARIQPSALPSEIGQEIADCLTYLDLYFWSLGMPTLVPSKDRVEYWLRAINPATVCPLRAGMRLVESVMSGCGNTAAALLALYHYYGEDTTICTFEETVCAKFNHVSDRVSSPIKLDARELIHVA